MPALALATGLSPLTPHGRIAQSHTDARELSSHVCRNLTEREEGEEGEDRHGFDQQIPGSTVLQVAEER